MGNKSSNSLGKDIQKAIKEGRAKYPFFTERLIVAQVRRDGWLIKNRKLFLVISETEIYGICYNYFFDGFSIPRLVWWLVPKNQPGLACAAWHDVACEFKFLPHKVVHKYLDLIMDAYTFINGEFVQEFNFTKWSRWAIPHGVYIGGPRWKQLGERPEWA